MFRRRRRTGSRFGARFDDSHLSYTTITALERFLATFSAPFVVIIGLLILALIGLVDAVTGSFAVAVFYLVPIGLVTYARGRWVGTLMAATAALAWTGVELAQHVTAFDNTVTYLNWLTRFYVYEAVVLLVAPLRDVVEWEREVANREAEAADKLRALNELRAAIEAEDGGQLARLEAMVEFQRAMTQAEIAHSNP
jgi:K+-sensing histidine kinase KdpD